MCCHRNFWRKFFGIYKPLKLQDGSFDMRRTSFTQFYLVLYSRKRQKKTELLYSKKRMQVLKCKYWNHTVYIRSCCYFIYLLLISSISLFISSVVLMVISIGKSSIKFLIRLNPDKILLWPNTIYRFCNYDRDNRPDWACLRIVNYDYECRDDPTSMK